MIELPIPEKYRDVVLTTIEQDLVRELLDSFDNINIEQAVKELIMYKRDQALYYHNTGNHAVAEMINTQLGPYKMPFKNS